MTMKYVNSDIDIPYPQELSDLSDKSLDVPRSFWRTDNGYVLRRIPKERKKIAGCVYILKATNGLYRIGRSKKPEKRIREHIAANADTLEIIAVYETNDYVGLENAIFDVFKHIRRGKDEWFALSESDLQDLLNILESKND